MSYKESKLDFQKNVASTNLFALTLFISILKHRIQYLSETLKLHELVCLCTIYIAHLAKLSTKEVPGWDSNVQVLFMYGLQSTSLVETNHVKPFAEKCLVVL